MLLVTGGAGFIGSHVVEAAVARGERVRVLDALRPDVHGRAAPALPAGVELVRASVTDAPAVRAALEGVTVVCHQAAKVGLGVDFADAPDYADANVTGTAVLLAAMTAAGVDRLVLASSMVVYGEGRYLDGDRVVLPPPRAVADLERGVFDPLGADGRPLEPVLVAEDAALDPRNVYADTKLAQEHLASSWTRATGGRAAMLRYHNVYGPRMPRDTPYAGVASIFRSALERGEAPRVFEDGGQRRDFVHVRDVARANLAALAGLAARPDGDARAYNVGSGTPRTVREFATALADAFGGPAPVVTGEYRLGDVRHITASSARIAEELGWRATEDFAGAVREFSTAPLRAID
ncbi:NAD-dependent epimerase/dehydratase family protein [Agromyces sp. SYSU T00194]|uniref:NAD-dependent epimerase/dehydratase family protein n=1 Tax=Agromyces chitinivorans TaxID=3158560 RepID=UPI0033956EA3